MSTGSSTHRRFEDRHPDLWDEVQVMIERQGHERAAGPSLITRLFRGTARSTRPEQDD